MSDNRFLFMASVLPILFAGSVLWNFHRYKRRKNTDFRWRWILSGNLLVLLFSVSVVVLVGEVYYRFVYDTTDSFGQTRTTKDWFTRHFHRNIWQYRDSLEYEFKIPAGKRRISFLGDSFTAGHGIADVEKRFANLIRAKEPDWEVHAISFYGWDTGQEMRLLKRSKDAGYELDVVVLVYCLNDIADLIPEYQLLKQRLSPQSSPGPLVDHSYFLNMMYHRIKFANDPNVQNYFSFVRKHYSDSTWEIQKARLREIHKDVLSRGGQLLVVTFPFLHRLGDDYEYRPIHKQLNVFWSEEKVAHLDLLSVFNKYRSDELIVNRHDAHPNEFAHAIAAEEILKFLEKHIGD